MPFLSDEFPKNSGGLFNENVIDKDDSDLWTNKKNKA